MSFDEPHRLPKEILLTYRARRVKQGTKGDRVEGGDIKLDRRTDSKESREGCLEGRIETLGEGGRE